MPYGRELNKLGEKSQNGQVSRGWFRAPNVLVRAELARKVGVYGIAVYCCLASHADQHGICWVALITIARELVIAKPTVNKAIKALKTAGLVTISRPQDRDAGSNSNTYTLTPIDSLSLFPFDHDQQPPPVNDVNRTSKRGEPPPVNDVNRTGKRGEPEQDPLTRPNEQDPMNKPPLPPKGERDGFEKFWEAYPRKVAKKKAHRAWAKLKQSPELLAMMVDALNKQKSWDQWTKDGGQFIPHPATWLNQERWTDEELKGETNGPQARNGHASAAPSKTSARAAEATRHRYRDGSNPGEGEGAPSGK
jgi:hypothetical protein